jgi:hypothetical protein
MSIHVYTWGRTLTRTVLRTPAPGSVELGNIARFISAVASTPSTARRRCVTTLLVETSVELRVRPLFSVGSTAVDARHVAAELSGTDLGKSPVSGRRGSNSRPLPWQGSALPLSYSRGSFDLS